MWVAAATVIETVKMAQLIILHHRLKQHGSSLEAQEAENLLRHLKARDGRLARLSSPNLPPHSRTQQHLLPWTEVSMLRFQAPPLLQVLPLS
jgi:hypothetical protein